jgi:hypothetical protein
VLGHGRNSVWITHREDEVGNVGCDKAKVVDAAVFVEYEF